MPTYEYGCEACGAQYELEQRITEDPIKKCKKCGKLKAQRLISGGNFMLKGGGWYADGYSSSSKTPSTAPAPAPSTPAPAASTDSGSKGSSSSD